MIESLERLHDLYPSSPDIRSNEPETSVAVKRRFFLGSPALLAASFLMLRSRRALAAEATFEEIAQQIGQLAMPMIQDPNRNEDEYLFHAASLAMKMKDFPTPQFGEPFMKVLYGSLVFRGSGIAVVQWKMEPDTTYPAHNHPGYAGITVGISGECRMRNFDYVGQPPEFSSKETFAVCETQNTLLRKGVVTSIMSTTRDNIHELQAGPQGVVAADIITRIGKDQGFSYVNISKTARNTTQGVFEATWGSHQAG
jgi:hypothetical protein